MTADILDLGSPFHTPTAKRYSTRFEATSSPVFATPIHRIRTPLRPSMLNSSPFAGPSSDATGVPESHGTESKEKLAGLNDLPVELVQQIHELAGNPFFALTTRYVYDIFTHVSPTYVARYMLYQYRHLGHKDILTCALRHPIVDISVIEEMRRIWDLRRGYASASATAGELGDSFSTPSKQSKRPPIPSTPHPTRPALEVRELPRRLFRWSNRTLPAINPMIPYLLDRYDPPLDAHKGYFLNRSALDQNYALVEFLLRRGANPNLREQKAVTVAVQRKDLRMVKLLVEPLPQAGTSGDDQSPAGRGKKRKLLDRVVIGSSLVKLAMSSGTPEIVEYFVNDKGAMPPLDDIMALGKRK